MDHTQISEMLLSKECEQRTYYTIDNGECSHTFTMDPRNYVKEHKRYLISLEDESLSRDGYLTVQKVIKALNGRWDRETQMHIFETDPVPYLEQYQKYGAEALNPYAFLETPYSVIRDLLMYAGIRAGETVLEPSAGRGAIANAVREDCPTAQIEVAEKCEYRSKLLAEQGFDVVSNDFLTLNGGKYYDRIVMNPPFSVKGDGSAYITHIVHALELLAKGGRLVTVAPLSWLWSDRHKPAAFRRFCEQTLVEGQYLERGAFKEKGTMIATCILVWDKD